VTQATPRSLLRLVALSPTARSVSAASLDRSPASAARHAATIAASSMVTSASARLSRPISFAVASRRCPLASALPRRVRRREPTELIARKDPRRHPRRGRRPPLRGRDGFSSLERERELRRAPHRVRRGPVSRPVQNCYRRVIGALPGGRRIALVRRTKLTERSPMQQLEPNRRTLLDERPRVFVDRGPRGRR
jgi:hypothetical protein